MLISVVEGQTFKRCHYRWSLQSNQMGNLENNSIAPALELGSMVHEALAWWTENPTEEPVKEFARLLKVRIAAISRDYSEATGGAEPSEDELAKVYEFGELGLNMIKNYQDFYKRPLPERFIPIQVEQRTIVAIPNTLHWGCPSCYWDHMPLVAPLYQDGASKSLMTPFVEDDCEELCPRCGTACDWVHHYLRGTMDTFVMDAQERVYVLERKTYAIRPTKAKLDMDDQMTSYFWILAQLFGYDRVGGILYDGLWKKSAPPKTVDRRKGTVEDLFFRDLFHRTPKFLAKFGSDLTVLANDMATAAYEGRLYTNRRWEGCYDCGVARICDANMRGEDVGYIIESYYRQRAIDLASAAVPDDEE